MTHIARTSRQLGALVQQGRKRRNWSQAELAALCGLRQETISKIENGHADTKLSSLYAILAALDLEILIRPRSKSSAQDIGDIF